MMEFYKTIFMGNGTGLSNLEQSILQDSDTVLSLTAKRCTKKDNHRSLYFDMSSLSNKNELQLAELRIYLPSSVETQDMTLQIYHSKEHSKSQLLGTLNMDSFITLNGFWKVLNLTGILNTYLQLNQSSNYEDFMAEESSPQRDHENNCTDISTDRVVMMVFTKDSPSPNIIQTVEASKYVMTPNVTYEQGMKRQRMKRFAKRYNFTERNIEHKPSLCRKVDMIVDFDTLGLGDIVISPKRFNAYRCEGACPIPLNDMFKPSNHAYIKSLVKLTNPEKVDCSSCAPVKFRPMSMLLYEGGKVLLRHQEDMIVEECGCH
ncbi:nodal homolog 2-A-like [Pyxicephalus adspersus]|uniref:nodal homolog 2-A-like n=1 Tax=Pyxicephalus adspersus TaxID=30357 RepID=UPI003B5B2E5C